MADLLRIKSNVAKMVDMGAPEQDIDDYISAEGVTVDDIRNFNSPFFKNNRDIRSTKIIPQFTKGLYERLPFGKRVVSLLPNAEEIKQNMENTPEAQGAFPVLSRLAGEVSPDFAMMTPFIGATGAIPKLPALMKLASGVGSYEGTKKAVEGKPGEIIPAALGSAAGTLALGYTGKGLYKMAKATPEAIKTIKNIPNKLFRGGLTKPEALRVETQYGSNNGSLVQVVKDKLNQIGKSADDIYNKVFTKAPENKFIDIKPSIEEAGARLKRLGLITKDGNLTQLGESEIARDSVYGKLLDFFQSSNAISGVENLQNKALTQGQMLKVMKAKNQTLVNKEQFLFLRNKLNSLYKNKPSDVDVNKVVNSFYQAGENSGLKGLQEARRLEREFFLKKERFLDSKGDLKIATEGKLGKIGTDKISQADIEHIKELQKYVNHPILKDAASINKLNRAKAALQRKKDVLIGAGIGTAVTLGAGGIAGGVARRLAKD